MRLRRRSRTGEESGFSMVEVAVTIGIIAMLVLSMTAALGNGFKYLLSSKQRAAATQQANAMLERARAIAQNDWTELGLVSSDLTGDANIISGSCGGQTASMYSGEPVITAGTSASNPLYPHSKNVSVGATVVTLKTYVTGVNPAGCSISNPAYKRVTVLATWAKGQPGVSNSVTLATFITPVTRPSSPDFQGTASYAGNSLVGQSAPTGGTAQTTAIFPPQSTADGRTVGLVATYKGAGISALGQVDGATATTQHTATTTVDDDSLTSGIPRDACDPSSCTPPPTCSLFADSNAWADFLGGMVGGTLSNTASSCSSVADASDGLPTTIDKAGLTNNVVMSSSVPAGGTLPGFTVENLVTSGPWSTSSIVDRVTVSGSAWLSSTATAVIPNTQMLRFNIPGVLPNRGVVELEAGTFTAQSHSGVGAGAPSVAGAMTFRIYDPASIIVGCSSRSGDYCVMAINPAVPGFVGFDQTYAITVDTPAPTPTARLIMTTNIKVFVPSMASTSTGGAVTQSTASFALPKITTSLVVQSPVGVTISTITDTMDFGQLVTAAFYSPS